VLYIDLLKYLLFEECRKPTEKLTELEIRFNFRLIKWHYLSELCGNPNCFVSKNNMPK
jgi:hypothetical protein